MVEEEWIIKYYKFRIFSFIRTAIKGIVNRAVDTLNVTLY